jgi:hypothetical protein
LIHQMENRFHTQKADFDVRQQRTIGQTKSQKNLKSESSLSIETVSLPRRQSSIARERTETSAGVKERLNKNCDHPNDVVSPEIMF